MSDFNEDVFTALVTDPNSPVDAATAMAASVGDQPQPSVNQRTNWFVVGMLIGGLVVFLLLLC